MAVMRSQIVIQGVYTLIVYPQGKEEPSQGSHVIICVEHHHVPSTCRRVPMPRRLVL